MPKESPPGDWTAAARAPLKLGTVAAIFLLIFLSPFVGFSTWNRIEASRIASRISAIERAGQPVRPAAGAGVPETVEQTRASRLYSEATQIMSTRAERFLESGAVIRDLATMAPDLARNDTRLATLSRDVDRYADVLRLLDEATPLDARGFAPGDVPRFPLEERRIAQPNAVRIALLSFTGDAPAAGHALMATLRLRRMSASRGLPGSMTTAHSLHLVLSSGSVSPSLLEQLQREYASVETDLGVEQRLVDNRAAFIASLFPGDISNLPPSGSTLVYRPRPFEALAYRLLRPMRRHSIASALDDYADALEVARVPWPDTLEAAQSLLERKGGRGRTARRRSLWQMASAPWGRHVASESLPQVVISTAEGLARARSAMAALGIARYRLDHGGALPAELAALVPAYVASVPQDPFSGAPLRYVSNGPAWKVYSVGTDRKDDGGAWYATSDLLPRRGEPEDLGIAVGYTDRPTR